MKREVRKILTVAVVMSLGHAPANAGLVFFDDFNGDALLPHWNQPPASEWEYDVGDGMLNVTGLFSPSHPKSPGNITGMWAPFAAQADFQMDVWMGWEPAGQPHRLAIQVNGAGGNPIIAQFGYSNGLSSLGPVIFASAGGNGEPITMPAPPPGVHHFTIARTGTEFHFFLNGSPFANLHDFFDTPAAAMSLEFVAPFPGPQGAFHIDRVQVVPSGGVVGLLLSGTLLRPSRRRR